MLRLVCLLNALPVLPFAASALLAPDFTFGLFGLDLGTEGSGVARGYGAAAPGWGLACLLLAGYTATGVARAILVASLAFNAAEVAVQVPVALSGIASAIIRTTIAAHALLAVLSAVTLVRRAAATAS